MKTLIILMLLLSLGACKKSGDSASKDNPKSPPNNPTPEPPLQGCSDTNSGFNEGDGSEESPYLIHTYAQLKKMKCNLNAHYKLEQNIDASPSWSEGESGCTAYDGSTVPESNACTGWVPIYKFQGDLNGDGHTITKLYANLDFPSAHNGNNGFFSQTEKHAKISNIGLVDANITVSAEGNDLLDCYSGGLVGINNGVINNSYVKGGTISAHCIRSSRTGGLVGLAYGLINNSYVIATTVRSFSSESFSYAGGLVGGGTEGTIHNSYVIAGEVSSHTDKASSSPCAGGLAGNFSIGTIRNSYATGAVSAFSQVGTACGGGLVGRVYQGTIHDSYATGDVSASNECNGGLVGRVKWNTATYVGINYFVDSSGSSSGIGNNGTCDACEAKTLDELQALTSTDVSEWNTNDWDFGTNSQLPRLKYAPTATYCSDNTHTTQQACEDASESWVVEGCGGDTGVTCGDVIPGQ